MEARVSHVARGRWLVEVLEGSWPIAFWWVPSERQARQEARDFLEAFDGTPEHAEVMEANAELARLGMRAGAFEEWS